MWRLLLALGVLAAIILLIANRDALGPVIDFVAGNAKTILKVGQVIGLFIAGYFAKLKLAATLIVSLCATELLME